MGTIFIVRHGETEWNALGRIQGHTDIELSDQGAEQARRLSQRLASVPIHAAYSSDLKRASQTAKLALGERDVVPHETPRLREYHKGAFEGLTLPQIQAQYPDEYPKYLEKDLDYAPQGGETVRDVSVRMQGILGEIKDRHLNENTLVVGHGGSLRAAMVSLLGMPLEGNWSFVFGNCALTVVDTFADNAVLRLFNDKSHLDGLTTNQI
ncbi:MAG: histidine phosphatase family protein [SAR202 cluster bacterium]|nr:alpha-ribazole phosphatase [Chloroflexota bacterium]MQF94576.1 histidine phosphatase family protein [SAR202 cluster bacterium]HAA94631.1 alpha-ribazole phosphatase [Dehalococcoidia bacterium]MQG33289.1 histidine phosphatase family protein [SAR202 cluster bacterium]HCL25358.1 alpha-ribazole phosphatase [Dehalococcoidia bacterium]|tara:strand:+ start:3638 stop:4264 length:627 start_codon:yes stop_codon:yes gene_type:complete